MTRISLAATLLILTTAGCASPVQIKAHGEISSQSISVGDRSRDYLLYSPGGSTERSEHRPLVLVFHGGGGTAKGIAREIGQSLHAIADAEGFYVVYPNAVNKMWDFGAGEVSEALDERIDDAAFFETLLNELGETLRVDKRRVFATGISRGGQASYFMACRFPDRIRAIAPVAMPMPVFMSELCVQSPAGTGVAILNGTKDPLVPYDGGQIKVGRKLRGEVMSTDDTVDYWRSKNRCSDEPSLQSVINPAKDRMTVRKTLWSQCELAPVLLYRIEDGGHTWPSGRQYLPKLIVGRVNRDIDGATEVWRFFEQFD